MPNRSINGILRHKGNIQVLRKNRENFEKLLKGQGAPSIGLHCAPQNFSVSQKLNLSFPGLDSFLPGLVST